MDLAGLRRRRRYIVRANKRPSESIGSAMASCDREAYQQEAHAKQQAEQERAREVVIVQHVTSQRLARVQHRQ